MKESLTQFGLTALMFRILAHWMIELYPVLVVVHGVANEVFRVKSEIHVDYSLQGFYLIDQLDLFLRFQATKMDSVLLLGHS